MSTSIRQLDELKIIGYADRLPDGLGPSIVPPVFSAGDTGWIIPPFRVVQEILVGGQIIPPDEIPAVRSRGRLTLPIGLEIVPKVDHSLWVDEAGQLRYESYETVQASLDTLHRRCIQEGEAALARGDSQAAQCAGRTAFEANPAPLGSYVLLAAADALAGHQDLVNLAEADAVAALHSTADFRSALQRCLDLVPEWIWEQQLDKAAENHLLSDAPAWAWAMPCAFRWLSRNPQHDEGQLLEQKIIPSCVANSQMAQVAAAASEHLIRNIPASTRRASLWQSLRSRSISARYWALFSVADYEKLAPLLCNSTICAQPGGVIRVESADTEAEWLIEFPEMLASSPNILANPKVTSTSLLWVKDTRSAARLTMIYAETICEESVQLATALNITAPVAIAEAKKLAAHCRPFCVS